MKITPAIRKLADEAGIELPATCRKAPAGPALASAMASAPGPWALAPAASHGGARFVVEIGGGFRPALLNELLSVHWARRHKMKRSDAEIVGMACHAAGVTRAVGKRRVTITLVVPKGGRRPDGDAPAKSLWDALAARHGCGAIVDDGPRWSEFPSLAYVVGESWGVRIAIEDVPAGKDGAR